MRLRPLLLLALGLAAGCRGGPEPAEAVPVAAPGPRKAPRRCAVLLHGLFRNAGSLEELARALEAAGWEPVRIGYPSTRRSVSEHAERVEEVLDSLEAEEVCFVTHSLGGIVAREVLSRQGRWRDRIRVGRMVMIAPPSQGSVIAQKLEALPGFDLIAGPSALDILPGRPRSIPAPDCPFAVIAGGRGDGRGFSLFIPGDDDGIVAVEETRLEGAEDFLLVPALHFALKRDRRVVESVVRYLETGRL